MKLNLEELKHYPDVLNKEQFRSVCHISKRTALYLLQSGLVRAHHTGKKTHSWLIRKEDIISYAEQYEDNPFVFTAPEKWYIYGKSNVQEPDNSRVPRGEEFEAATKKYYTNLLENEKDVLTTQDIVRITGYSTPTICRWVHRGKLKSHFAYVEKYYIPKVFLFSFLCGDFYNYIVRKTPEHIKSIHDICDMVYCGKVGLDEMVMGEGRK